MKTRPHILIAATMATISMQLGAQENWEHKDKHRQYRVVVLPPERGADSFLGGYLYYAPLTDQGALGVAADTSTPDAPPFNSYTWTNGKQIDLQPLPQLPNLTGRGTFVNWINGLEVAAGYGTRTNTVSGTSLDNAAVWAPNGQVFELSTPEGDQSHAVWINDFGQVSGWIANSTVDSCSGLFSGTGFQTQGVVWDFGVMIPLGTLGGTNSYGEFINNRRQVSGHAETSNVPDPTFGCPPFDPFIWENGKMIDINPGNFGGPYGGTNFLNNRGQRLVMAMFTMGLLTRSFGTAERSRTFSPWATWEGVSAEG